MVRRAMQLMCRCCPAAGAESYSAAQNVAGRAMRVNHLALVREGGSVGEDGASFD